MKPLLQVLTTGNGPYGHKTIAELACRGGAGMVQFREKQIQNIERLTRTAQDCLYVCKAFRVPLIINDHLEVASRIQADGVHLGQEDEDVEKAREVLGKNAIIGGTANTFEQVQELAEKRVDYIGLGPYRTTSTKEKLSPILGLEGYRNIIEKMEQQGINIPIMAIGGIKEEDIGTLLSVGVHSIAVASAITHAADPQKNTREFVEAMKRSKHKAR